MKKTWHALFFTRHSASCHIGVTWKLEKHGKSFLFHFHSKRKNPSTSVFKCHFTQLPQVASATLAPRGRMRLLLTLPAALAFAGGFFRCFLKGPGRYFPQLELEMIVRDNLSLDRALLWKLLFNGAITALMFLILGKNNLRGCFFFRCLGLGRRFLRRWDLQRAADTAAGAVEG